MKFQGNQSLAHPEACEVPWPCMTPLLGSPFQRYRARQVRRLRQVRKLSSSLRPCNFGSEILYKELVGRLGFGLTAKLLSFLLQPLSMGFTAGHRAQGGKYMNSVCRRQTFVEPFLSDPPASLLFRPVRSTSQLLSPSCRKRDLIDGS